jgi:hypothetical protein
MTLRSNGVLLLALAALTGAAFGACSGDDAAPVAANPGKDGSTAGGTAGSSGRGAGGSAGGSGDAGSGGRLPDGALPDVTAGSGGQAGSGDAQPDSRPTCDAGTTPVPTGRTIEVTPPMTLSAALADAEAGDRIVLHAGSYGSEEINDVHFSSFVFVEAAAGQNVTLPGLHFRESDHIAFRGVRFDGTVELEASSHFMFHGVTFDGGSSDDAALHLQGQGGGGASHDVLVANSTLRGGGRTVFVLGRFAPSEQWNHHITFVDNDVSCGMNVCFQLSGARDMTIEGNRITSTSTSGVLSAGATRITIARNRFTGTDGRAAAAQIATPGMEWDNYAGVENMISSAIVIANNVIDGFGTAVQLDAARDVAIVYNTVADGAGIRFNHRTPHDQQGNVILDGNSEIRVWNNVLPTIVLTSGEERPAFESNNLVFESGGGGMNPISGDPAFGSGADYPLSAGSPAVNAALSNAETPAVDYEGNTRGPDPDVGARELGATPACP